MFESASRILNVSAFLSIFEEISPSNRNLEAFKTCYIYLGIVWVRFDEIEPGYLISKVQKYLTKDLCPSKSKYFL